MVLYRIASGHYISDSRESTEKEDEQAIQESAKED
jgi:predicted nucleic acid-binding Zn ribbon protein